MKRITPKKLILASCFLFTTPVYASAPLQVAYTTDITQLTTWLNASFSNTVTWLDTEFNNTILWSQGYTGNLGVSTAGVLGGGASYNPVTGFISYPTINVAGSAYNNVTNAIQALNAYAIQYDKVGGAPNLSSVTLDGATGTLIHNVKAGVVGTDAVNVQQLTTGQANTLTSAQNYADTKITQLGNSTATQLGGGATYDPVTGAITPSTYTIGANTYNNVGSALTAADNQTAALGNSTAANIGGGATFDTTTGAISSPTINVSGSTYNDTTSAIQTLDSYAAQYDKIQNGEGFSPDYNNLTLLGSPSGTTIHNLTAGVAGMDAVNVDQLTALSTKTSDSLSSVASIMGGGAIYDPVTGSITPPAYTIGTGAYNDVGSALTAVNNQTAALFTAANNQTASTTALGNSTAFTLGGGATYDPVTGAITPSTYTIGTSTYNNVGSALTAADNQTAALGNSTAANIGGGAVFDPTTGTISAPTISVAGTNYSDTTSAIQALDAHAVQYDKNADGTSDYSNSTLAGVNGTTVHNVADGVLANDAANFGQVNKLADSTASAIGGGAVFDPTTGTISAPTISVAGTNYNDTTSAIQALNGHGVQYDNNPDGTPNYSSLTLSGTNNTTIHNVQMGVASTDAVNVNQLSALDSKGATSLTSVAATLGGGATYNSTTGAITPSTYTIGKKSYNDVGSAFNATNAALATTNNQSLALGNSTAANTGGGATYNQTTGAVSAPTIGVAGTNYSNTTSAIEALDAHAVQYDNNPNGSPNYSSLTLSGTTGTTIHNVQAGVAPTDAANTQQVIDAQHNAITTSNSYTNVQIATLNNQNQAQFKSLNNQIKATGSIAAAMSGLVPNYQSSSALQVQAAVGYGSGAAGVAAGTTYQVSNDVLLVGKMGVSTTSGVGAADRIGGAVGVSFGL